MIRFDDSQIDISSSYGGSDQKRGIIYQGAKYMLKLSDRVAETKRLDINSSYSNSALSEYISCHIIEMIGIPVQSTLLGRLNRWSDYHKSMIDDIVVACKNFLDPEHTLVEFKQLANTILPTKIGKLPKIEELYDTLQSNVYFSVVMADLAMKRYWDTFVIDALLGNFDRHGNNWGYLINKNTLVVSLAPIYDCGSCLYPQISDNGCEEILASEEEIHKRIYTFPNAALVLEDGSKANYYSFINERHNPDCDAALLRIVPNINFRLINGFIDSIECISSIRKEFYKIMLRKRYDCILLPRYSKLLNNGSNGSHTATSRLSAF